MPREIAGHEEWTRRALAERIGESGAGFALLVDARGDPMSFTRYGSLEVYQAG
jgi:hypothetical protein